MSHAHFRPDRIANHSKPADAPMAFRIVFSLHHQKMTEHEQQNTRVATYYANEELNLFAYLRKKVQ